MFAYSYVIASPATIRSCNLAIQRLLPIGPGGFEPPCLKTLNTHYFISFTHSRAVEIRFEHSIDISLPFKVIFTHPAGTLQC